VQKETQMFYKYISNLSIYLTVLLGLVAITGDYVVSHTKIHIFQALFDNSTHALIGGLSWFITCLIDKNHHSYQILLEVAVCSFIASIIDLDHFVAAKSLQLKDATNLKQRPPLHCSTFPLVTCILLLFVSYILQLSSVKRGTLIILTAFASHHTRDATRRGYWFYPFGCTPSIPYGIYVVTTCFIPYFMGLLYEFIKINSSSNSYDRFAVI
ncbi:hypothetical protein NQ314_005802, partial [Rhamnusium bicolor]